MQHASSTESPRFADPTAFGLFGLAIGCAALLPVALGIKAAFTPDALRTCALFCLLFGGGCQLFAGLMSFANKNMLGGTLLTTFSFNWIVNAWSFRELAEGRAASSTVIFAVDICFLLIFLVMTFAFGFYSRLLRFFLVDIDVLYGLRIAKEVTHSPAFTMPIAAAVILLMAIALYLAFALALANAAGRVLLPIGGPVFQPSSSSSLDRAPPASTLVSDADSTLRLQPSPSMR
jgi:succinate-acetate transporter protein